MTAVCRILGLSPSNAILTNTDQTVIFLISRHLCTCEKK